ncbi:MAG TPA: hypothetical protein VH210_02870 [Gaiellaceae bacterium]|nr:hypothetical protein [Gaiellaceae bacterium]
MDIGHTIRSFTIEPLRSPVPPLRKPEPATELEIELERELALELEASPASVPFASLIAPTLMRRLG